MNREKSAGIFFETFGVPAFNIEKQALLSLFASGYSTGLAVQSGEGVTKIVPVVEGNIDKNAIMVFDVVSRTITEVLAKKMKNRGVTDGTVSKDYKLPDGQVIHLGMERFEVTEVLFDPKLLNLSVDGIHKKVHDSLSKLEDDERKDVTNGIFLGGGNTLLNGIETRLKTELSQLGIEAEIRAPAERKFSTWIGGSMRTALSVYQHLWILREQYDEYGANITNTKKF
ncbi:actin [Podila minutissima]|uniref:Actin n=1 Tax=Podila minutissima TaxID=64525 RepID=A0A9P5SRU0_9FUNG|nr:actin [Podila minutissima]